MVRTIPLDPLGQVVVGEQAFSLSGVYARGMLMERYDATCDVNRVSYGGDSGNKFQAVYRSLSLVVYGESAISNVIDAERNLSRRMDTLYGTNLESMLPSRKVSLEDQRQEEIRREPGGALFWVDFFSKSPP